MSADELRGAERKYQRDHARAEKSRAARNKAVCDALAEGMTHAQIAAATGLTRARVGQIALTCKEAKGA